MAAGWVANASAPTEASECLVSRPSAREDSACLSVAVASVPLLEWAVHGRLTRIRSSPAGAAVPIIFAGRVTVRKIKLTGDLATAPRQGSFKPKALCRVGDNVRPSPNASICGHTPVRVFVEGVVIVGKLECRVGGDGVLR